MGREKSKFYLISDPGRIHCSIRCYFELQVAVIRVFLRIGYEKLHCILRVDILVTLSEDIMNVEILGDKIHFEVIAGGVADERLRLCQRRRSVVLN